MLKGTMKSLHPAVHNKQDRSDLIGSRRAGRWGFNVTEMKSRTLEINVQRINRLQATGKLDNTALFVSRSNHALGMTKPRRATNAPLPPISCSKTISNKVDPTAAPPLNRKDSAKPKRYSTNLPTGNKMKENSRFHEFATQFGKVDRESKKYNKITVALAARNKEAIQDAETCSRLIKQSFDDQPDAKLTLEPADPLVQQRKNDVSNSGASDSRMMMPVRVKHDASLCKPSQQRGLCSDDSAVETVSEDSEDKGQLGRSKEDSDDEYYTDQRITEWVLKVNSSLFSTENNKTKRSKPAEEQDVATIKIIYSGD